ncbi:MAG: alpha-L-fucosidase [Bacteroidota bacterium]
MKYKKISTLFVSVLLAISTANPVFSQFEHDHHHRYYPETDSLVLEKLEHWQDLKFGLLMHWGAYSQWGIVESWSLSPEDYDWCKRYSGENPQDYFEYKTEYENLISTFNPVDFDPSRWANAASEAGMKYVVFTTKHHDGFCMWDTKETDYKITSEKCPFHTSERADVTREIFDAFRERDLWTGAYFSKPDWHSEYYWWPYFPPFDRNVNYDPETYPERWENFVQFTHKQIMELMTSYGNVDILWLDGGWVAKQDTEEIRRFYDQRVQKSPSGFMRGSIVNQDIRMDELVEKARSKQPGLIVVDRAVPGPNQNYLTPENTVPDEALPYPWESCIISGGGWSWSPPEKARYKTSRETIHMLSDIVSKGGNLLLNIAPGPHGDWHPQAYELLAGIGQWMDVNSEAIYGTRFIAPYKEGNVCLTSKEDIIYAIYLAGKDETVPPARITLESIQPGAKSVITMLGHKGRLKWKREEKGFSVEIPEKIRNNPASKHAWVLKITKAQ